jgi:TonB-dependent SusC/RagA subfamily outer membrane receptor
VLKGAAAATLYGTEASNGVIQIFTKRGSAGAPRWDFTAEQIASQFPGGQLKPVAGFARTPAQATRCRCSTGARSGRSRSSSATSSART